MHIFLLITLPEQYVGKYQFMTLWLDVALPTLHFGTEHGILHMN